MCFHLVLIIALAVSAPSQCFLASTDDHCPWDWTFYEGDGSCLRGYDEAKVFADAKKECMESGGNLVIIRDQGKNDLVADMIQADFGIPKPGLWIGVEDPAKDRNFRYVDGTPLDFPNWYPGQPDNYDGWEYCAFMLKLQGNDYMGKWDDTSCIRKMPFVCEKIINDEPEEYGGDTVLEEMLEEENGMHEHQDDDDYGENYEYDYDVRRK